MLHDPITGRFTGPSRTTEERFWSKVDKSAGPDGCWHWTGSLNNAGYGNFWLDGKLVLAHRYAIGLTGEHDGSACFACHHCDNPPCVRPDHLYVGTNSDNMRDSARRKRHKDSKKTHCIRGHAFTPGNTMVNKVGHRRCRECKRMRRRAGHGEGVRVRCFRRHARCFAALSGCRRGRPAPGRAPPQVGLAGLSEGVLFMRKIIPVDSVTDAGERCDSPDQ